MPLVLVLVLVLVLLLRTQYMHAALGPGDRSDGRSTHKQTVRSAMGTASSSWAVGSGYPIPG